MSHEAIVPGGCARRRTIETEADERCDHQRGGQVGGAHERAALRQLHQRDCDVIPLVGNKAWVIKS